MSASLASFVLRASDVLRKGKSKEILDKVVEKNRELSEFEKMLEGTKLASRRIPVNCHRYGKKLAGWTEYLNSGLQ